MSSTGDSAAGRTALAWSRSSLAIVAVAALVVKSGVDGGHSAIGFGGGAVLLGLAAAVWVTGRRGRSRTRAARLRLIALASAASAAIAFALVVIS